LNIVKLNGIVIEAYTPLGSIRYNLLKKLTKDIDGKKQE